MKKNLLLRILIPFLTLIVVALVTPVHTHAQRLFTDVTLDSPYFEAVAELSRRGVINGYADGTFQPAANVSRSAALKIILLSAGTEISGTVFSRPFPDVPEDAWYASIAKKGLELGVVKGDGQGYFWPERNVARSEALAILFRTAGTAVKTPGAPPFADVPLTAWYAGYFAEAKNRGLITGNKAAPDQMLNRGEVSDLTYRFFKNNWVEDNFAGVASYYGDGFEGSNTASGEKFSNREFLAAHRDLPFGTHVRVTDNTSLRSAVVKIVDRGPYVSGRVIDLSQIAFEVFAPLSQGVARVTLEVLPETTPLGISTNCPPPDPGKNLGKDTFAGIHLLHELPTVFRSGEVYVLAGETLEDTAPTRVTAYYGDGEQKHYFSKIPTGSVFRIPVYFDTAGTFDFSVFSGLAGTSKSFSITVISPVCDAQLATTTSGPKNLRPGVTAGQPVLAWDDAENNLFRIEIRQDAHVALFFTTNDTSLELPLFPFQDFSEGLVTVRIWGAKSDGGALARTSGWAYGGERKAYAVGHVSGDGNKLTDITITDEFELGKSITIRGTTDSPLDPKAVVIQPDNSIIDLPLTLEGNTFSATLTPNQNGKYIFEINNNAGLSLFVGTSVPRGMIPLLPDYFDIKNGVTEVGLDTGQMPPIMLNSVNREREIRKLAALILDENLSNLARFRAQDMCDNKYISHTDPKGKTAEDYRALYNVQTVIGENIVKDTGVLAAHASLMRSPDHRKLIISNAYSRIGLGFCYDDEDPRRLTVVEIFGGEPFLSANIPAYREKVLADINSIRISNPILPSAVLESVAQNWAETMAKHDFWGFEYNGDSLEKNLRAAGVKSPAKSIVLKIGSILEMTNAFKKPEISIGDASQDNFLLSEKFKKMGIGFAQNDTWDIFFVVIGIE